MSGLGPDDAPAHDPAYVAAVMRAVRLAAKCFEIARSTKFPGEREAAISRGIAIAEKAGLNLDLFNIPGRSEADQLRHAVEEAADTLGRWIDRLRAGDHETVYDAKRRAFDQAATEAAERDRRAGRRAGPALDPDELRRAELRDRWPSVGAALNALRARRHRAEDGHDPLRPGVPVWYVSGWGDTSFDEWQLREHADRLCS
ncbi:hypothetical protein [Sphingomonas sp. VNH70]|uniref:hypothetical protein n=1 Tax=Sphingomonas silueang TaxID=3156617 RepID=UPI0032B4BA1C